MGSTDSGDALKPSFWDTVPVRAGGFWLGTAMSSKGFRRRRLGDRIGAVVRLAGSNGAAGVAEEELDAIGAELRDRRAFWHRLLKLDQRSEAPADHSLRRLVANTPGELLVGLFLVPLAIFLWRAVIAILVVLLILTIVRRPNVRARARQALTTEECPECDYPLAELSASVALERRLECRLGPERCPECGCGWPLVPASIEAGPERGKVKPVIVVR
jgi:hypothetical protein